MAEARLVIRRILPGEHGSVVRLGTRAFAAFGDYSRALARWLRHPSMWTLVAELEGEFAGFCIVYVGYDPLEQCWYGELMAIAVEERFRGMGIGRDLVRAACRLAKAVSSGLPVTELRLTVADTNEVALGLFASEGFVEVGCEEGYYDGGQRALRMIKLLEP